MFTGLEAFSHPLKSIEIEIGQQNFLLSGRFLEYALPLPIISNLDLEAPDGAQVEYREGLLLIEAFAVAGTQAVIGHSIYTKSPESLMLAKLEADIFIHEFSSVFHRYAEKMTGFELIIPAYQNVIGNEFGLVQEEARPRTSRTGIVEALLRTHQEIQLKKVQQL